MKHTVQQKTSFNLMFARKLNYPGEGQVQLALRSTLAIHHSERLQGELA